MKQNLSLSHYSKHKTTPQAGYIVSDYLKEKSNSHLISAVHISA